MSNLDDIVGNLGEPLDFVEYRLDDEDDAKDVNANGSANTDLRDAADPCHRTPSAARLVRARARPRCGSAAPDAPPRRMPFRSH